MAQKAVEVILLRQLASCLATPMMLFDQDGTLLFYNEPAESLIGYRFDETGEMSFSQWDALFYEVDDVGIRLPATRRPVLIALEHHLPAYAEFWLRTFNGRRRKVEATAVPLMGQGGRHLGAVVTFWETGKP